jgi:hypothetical protein
MLKMQPPLSSFSSRASTAADSPLPTATPCHCGLFHAGANQTTRLGHAIKKGSRWRYDFCSSSWSFSFSHSLRSSQYNSRRFFNWAKWREENVWLALTRSGSRSVIKHAISFIGYWHYKNLCVFGWIMSFPEINILIFYYSIY